MEKGRQNKAFEKKETFPICLRTSHLDNSASLKTYFRYWWLSTNSKDFKRKNFTRKIN